MIYVINNVINENRYIVVIDQNFQKILIPLTICVKSYVIYIAIDLNIYNNTMLCYA